MPCQPYLACRDAQLLTNGRLGWDFLSVSIMFIYRDDYYNKENSKSPGITEIIIAKQRNGPVGDVKLTFLKPMTRFENLAPGSGGEY